MFIFLILVVLLWILIYKWGTSTFDYFEKRGVAYKKPVFLIGNAGNLITRKLTFADAVKADYNRFPNEKIVGNFGFRTPSYLIRDPEILKKIAIKDFEYFQDRQEMVSPDLEPLIARCLFGLNGDDWHQMRSTLSPAFTGNKLRQMLKLVSQVGKQSVETLKEQIGPSGAVLEMRDFLSKFTVDVIATCAFGIEIDSFKDPDNEFQEISKSLINFANFSTGLRLAGYILFPKFMRFWNIRMFNKRVCEYFEAAIIDVMEERENKGIVRHDLINILMEAKKGQIVHSEEEEKSGFASVEESQIGKSKVTKKWSDIDLLAQAFIFFFAGFESISGMMSFGAYEMAIHPDIQDKLIQEIDEVRKSLGDQDISYERIRDMKYLDQVISEILRKWPPLIMDRKCVKDYVLEYDGRSLLIEKGTNFGIPFVGFHYDPKYFPDPDKFDPERFSDQNKGNIIPHTYLPFGIGPRNCIGSRFALMELKTLFYYILSSFRFEVCEKTQIPLKLGKTPFAVRSEKGIWLNFKKR